MKYFIAIAAVALMGTAACQQKAPAAASFEFTVQKQENALTFKAVRGAEWNELSYTCQTLPCDFVLDNAGVNVNTPGTGFSIAMTLDAKEVKMASTAGADWKTLTYACESKACAFRVDEKGVAGL
ncbi:MAG TPA: hypothetical protein DCW72_04000 [Elusimicrobia bacterium]|nr:MAG: hypothetical protein A2X29_10735 [Elusimicrobia bacterium GWA2_64_40]OGR62548.1 MAG: hypothetical protein A2X30_07895 [Elusimicrobia bacterium GWB2_63_16]HAN05956.1 hypothetical protein [Elusimicrobiota bacterium]HAU89411.1 hypothetical protein [Elusimicrobiota bacterium]